MKPRDFTDFHQIISPLTTELPAGFALRGESEKSERKFSANSAFSAVIFSCVNLVLIVWLKNER
jgi:hypothetical protein